MNQEWENRVLCSDGNCIGVIGADGHCKECGKPYEGRLPKNFGEQSASAASEAARQPQSETTDAQPAPVAEQHHPELPASDDEWENRLLCSDGNCIGVIGADGRCKECGKPYTPDPSS